MKKKMKFILSAVFSLFLGVSLVLPATNVRAASTPKIKTYKKKYSGKKKSKLTCEAEFQGLKMSGKSKLAKSVNSYSNKEFKNFKSEWKLVKDFAMSKDAEGSPMPHTLYTTLFVKGNNNSRYLSLASGTTEYVGGVHPSHYTTFVTFNKKNGKKISLKNVANCSIKTFNKKVVNRLSKKMPATSRANFNKSYKPYILKYKFSQYNFYYKKNKLHIYFNPYEAGPYALGAVDIVMN